MEMEAILRLTDKFLRQSPSHGARAHREHVEKRRFSQLISTCQLGEKGPRCSTCSDPWAKRVKSVYLLPAIIWVSLKMVEPRLLGLQGQTKKTTTTPEFSPILRNAMVTAQQPQPSGSDLRPPGTEQGDRQGASYVQASKLSLAHGSKKK